MLFLCFSRMLFRQCNSLIPKIQILERNFSRHFLTQPVRLRSTQHVYACNVRIASLSRAGKVEAARQLFDTMPERDVVSWNAMVTGYWQNRDLKESKMLFDLMPGRNVVSWNSMIAGCVENERVDEAFEYFCNMPGRNTASWNAMISGFVRYGRIEEASSLFDKMPGRNVISYCAMIDGYARNGKIRQARALFDCMLSRNDVTWTVMISGYVMNGRFEEARELFDRMPDKDVNVIATTVMITGYCKERQIENARSLFEAIQLKDCASFNAMITGYAQNGNGEEALKLHTQMLRWGMKPDHSTLVSVLTACSTLPSLKEGRRTHVIILKRGFDSHLSICNALITMYSKCGGILDSESAFSHLNNPDLVSWNTIIAAFAQHGLYETAVSFFSKMRMSRCEPDGVTFLGLFSACGHSGMVNESLHWFDSMVKNYKLIPRREHYSCLVDILGRAGQLEKAYDMIKEMPFEPDAGIWGALLSGCCAYSNAELGQLAAEKYFELDPQNSGAYIMLSNIYAAAGMWKEVKNGQRIYEIDPLLRSHRGHLDYRYSHYRKMRDSIDKYEGGLEMFSRGYEKFGFNRSATGVTYREWAPGAKSAALIGDFNNWNPNADIMTRDNFGVWEIFLPNNADGSPPIPHGSRVKIRMDTPSGIKDSIPAWIKFSVQAPGEIPFNGIYYDPPEEEKYSFKHPRLKKPKSLRIYESHVGMSSTEPMINTYANFRDDVLPRIKKLGYNAVQIMAIQEHSYYASFGYHVTNFFAPSSRCGTPDELKSMIDRAHELGLVVLMDIVHSHASNNTLDGLNMFDGTDSHYFHSGSRGYHWMWDSRLFNYGHWEVIRFLLSNARWWLEEYKFDGFRFDGVTSMMYTHHGLQVAFTGNYNEYFGFATDVDAVVYLMLVNDLIHGLFPEAISIGEDVSGMPTFCIPVQDGGVGFDYRLHMAIADKWIELLKKRDEDWRVGDIVHTLTNRRWSEKCVSYAESHDQALVGDKTIAFWLMDKDMYDFMALDRPSTPLVDRGIALHKMIRLITMGLGGEGYLNFMGNEFGHPEWIDFPRGNQHLPDGRVVPGNGLSYDKCRRRFDLGDADYLRYHGMQEFDRAMQHLEEAYSFMTSEHQYISRKDERDRMIVFERGNLVFVFNFHWNNSYFDYQIGCLKPGKYKIVLDSDDKLFGGFNRLDHNAEYFTSDGWYDDRPRSFLVYAPCRTAVVYALVKNDPQPV